MYDPFDSRIAGKVALSVLNVPRRSMSMTVLKARSDSPEMGARLGLDGHTVEFSLYEQVSSGTCH
jgi:hypothetical protein